MSDTEPKPLPDKTIQVYLIDESVDPSAWIRPGRPTRGWMDRTQGRYAYRCIPLSAANSMGWEILNPVNCEFRWNGMTDPRGVYVWTEKSTAGRRDPIPAAAW